MKKFFVICLLLLVIVTGCGKKKDDKISDAKRFKEEYEEYNGETYNYIVLNDMDISSENAIYYASEKDVDYTLKNSGVILFCNPKSNECRDVIPVLLDVAKSNSVKKIKYINNLTDDYKNFIKDHDDLNDTYVIFVKDSEIIATISQTDFKNDSEYKKIRQKINYNIEQIYSDYCDETC